MPPRKKRLTFKRLLLGGAFALCLLVGWFFFQILGGGGPITVSPQTTVLTEPLADDGLPEYARAMLDEMRDGVTAESNGAIPFIQAMWPMDLKGHEQLAICSELEIDMPDEQGMMEPYSDEQVIAPLGRLFDFPLEGNEEPIDEITVDDRARELVDYAYAYPWRGDDLPPLKTWLDENARHFDLLLEAANRPEWYLPTPGLLTTPKDPQVAMLLPHIQVNRSAWRCLLMRAYYHLGEGDSSTAWRDCRAVYELSLKSHGETLVGEFVSIAGEGMANSCTLQILHSDNLTPEVAENIHRYLQSREPRSRMARAIDRGERLGFVTSILAMSGQRPTSTPGMGAIGPQSGVLKLLAGSAMDWDLILTIGNEWYDKLVEALEIENYRDRKTALDAYEASLTGIPAPGVGGAVSGLLSRKSRSKSMANILATLLLPAISASSEAEDRANADLALMKTVAALVVHKNQTGDFPQSLAELDTTAELDLYTGKPLSYRKTKRGYLLYSLGANGKDDGGSNEVRERYLGYAVYTGDEPQNAAVCKLLGETAQRPVEGIAGRENDFEPNWLEEKIPQGADDHAIRLPLPTVPLPALASPE